MTQYAVRYGDTRVYDPSWRCVADVIATYHAAYCDEDRRVTGVLEVVGYDPADDMCPNCLTPWKCNGPHVPPLTESPHDLADERTDVLDRFMAELAKATGDGSKKRQAGTKPPWYEDDAHEAAIFSHLMKWKRGELVDPDSGAHPLVHLAWRALAIACKESGNTP